MPHWHMQHPAPAFFGARVTRLAGGLAVVRVVVVVVCLVTIAAMPPTVDMADREAERVRLVVTACGWLCA